MLDVSDQCVCQSSCLTEDEQAKKDEELAQQLAEQAKQRQAAAAVEVTVNAQIKFQSSVFNFGSLSTADVLPTFDTELRALSCIAFVSVVS